MIEELVIQCEEHLLNTNAYSPMHLLQVAHKYQLPSLEESAAIKASKLTCVEKQAEFKTLTTKQQEKVLNMSRNRYRSGKSAFSHHTDDVFYYEKTPPSSESKRERQLREIENELNSILEFKPDKKKIDSLNGRTRT